MAIDSSDSKRIVYVSFDRVPSPKGAAIHIRAFARALGKAFGRIDLITPETDATGIESTTDRWPGVDHHRLPAPGDNLIKRALTFRDSLRRFWDRKQALVHFRSIFEGYPLVVHKERVADRLLFEVNGLPSIELKYHHPDVADDRELLAKLHHQEDACLRGADRIVTPSEVTRDHLVSRGVPAEKIRVIPNGVDPHVFSFSPTKPRQSDEPVRMLYAGTVTAWQGVGHAIAALGLFCRERPATLSVIGPTRGQQRRQIDSWCRSAGVLDRVELVPPMSQRELALLHHEHDVVVAPLLPNDRNTVQGCCPLKVLEAMASGTPLVASNLPVVRALARPDIDAILVRPGSARAIREGMLRLSADPALGPRIARIARHRVERRFTWERSCEALIEVYDELLD